MLYYNVRDIQEQSCTGVCSRLQMFFKIGVIKKFAIFTGKHLCWRLFLINFVKRRLQHRCFAVNISKFLRTAFFIEHFRWLLLQMLYKKDVPKNFANFTRMHRYRSPFLSSCRPITCNFVKIEGPVKVFCCEFCEISQNNFMQNNFDRLPLDVKMCCGK